MQRKMLRLIIQTKRKYKKTQSKDDNKVIEEVGKPENEKDGKEDEENLGSSEDETEDGHSSNTNCDQDSDISFMNDNDEEIDTAVIEEEDRIEYMKRSTDVAIEQMKTPKIQCWIKTHRRMKWILAMRIKGSPSILHTCSGAGFRAQTEWCPEEKSVALALIGQF